MTTVSKQTNKLCVTSVLLTQKDDIVKLNVT